MKYCRSQFQLEVQTKKLLQKRKRQLTFLNKYLFTEMLRAQELLTLELSSLYQKVYYCFVYLVHQYWKKFKCAPPPKKKIIPNRLKGKWETFISEQNSNAKRKMQKLKTEKLFLFF